MSEVAERVQRGVDLLDSKVENWADLIDPTELDLRDVHDCVLGQIFGSYFRGVDNLFGVSDDMDEWDEATSHGFSAEIYDGQGREDEWDALNAGWRECIIDRRMADGEAFVAEHIMFVHVP